MNVETSLGSIFYAVANANQFDLLSTSTVDSPQHRRKQPYLAYQQFHWLRPKFEASEDFVVLQRQARPLKSDGFTTVTPHTHAVLSQEPFKINETEYRDNGYKYRLRLFLLYEHQHLSDKIDKELLLLH